MKTLLAVVVAAPLFACVDRTGTDPEVATAEQAVITQCPYLDPADPSF